MKCVDANLVERERETVNALILEFNRFTCRDRPSFSLCVAGHQVAGNRGTGDRLHVAIPCIWCFELFVEDNFDLGRLGWLAFARGHVDANLDLALVNFVPLSSCTIACRAQNLRMRTRGEGESNCESQTKAGKSSHGRVNESFLGH